MFYEVGVLLKISDPSNVKYFRFQEMPSVTTDLEEDNLVIKGIRDGGFVTDTVPLELVFGYNVTERD